MSEGKEVPLAVARVIETCRTFHTEETITKALSFKPGSKDCIISTAIKSGTTVTQQICHGLRSGGDMSFEEIAAVSPYIEGAYDYGCNDLHALQPYEPHLFKTHFWYPLVPKGTGKYIVVARKPADTALSLYYFFEDWFFKKGEISIEDFMNFIWINIDTPATQGELCSTVRHITSWYPHRFDENVLWLHYEDIIQNRRECVRLVAKFLEIEADEALLDLVTKQSSFEFMKKHLSKFDENIVKRAKNEALGFDKNAGLSGSNGKVRTGQIDSGKAVFSSSILEKIDAQWTEVVTSATGYKTYEDLRNGINKELKRNFD